MELNIEGWKRYISVQPSMILIVFATAMSGTILTDLLEFRMCKMILDTNATECLTLHNHDNRSETSKINMLVQPRVSLILMCKSFIEAILPAVLSLFLGPWSDKYGRKPLLLAGYTGCLMTYFLLSLMAFLDVEPWLYLIAFVPHACSGGFCILLLASFCYISDISNECDRAWQLACFDTLILFGVIVGIFSGPFIYDHYGYCAVFSTATVCLVLADLYILFYVPETIQHTSSVSCCSLFDMSLVKDLINTCTKKRDGFDRLIVWSCIMCLTLYIVTMQADMTIGYLFASAQLGWDVNQYSIFTGTSVLLSIIGTVLGVKVVGAIAGLSEIVLAFIATISSLGSVFIKAFTLQSWHMYLATIVGAFNSILGPMIRTVISKSVPPTDAGKVFSLTTTIETIMPFGASSLYAMVYSHYMPPLYPSPVWLVSAGFYLLLAILLISIQIRIVRTNSVSYRLMSENSE